MYHDDARSKTTIRIIFSHLTLPCEINEFLTSEITYVADNKISLDDEKCEKVMNLIEALEAIDDVQDVYHNMEV